MKLVSFHLMPYRPLDLEEAAKHRSPWVVLPNRQLDHWSILEVLAFENRVAAR